MPAESGLIKNAAVFPTSSMVTFLRIGDVAATALNIFPKSLMPEADRVLMGPALMPLTLIFLDREARKSCMTRNTQSSPKTTI